MATFKGERDKLCYTQHTLLSNVRHLPSFLTPFLETKKHTQSSGNEILIQMYTTNSTQKLW